MTKFHKNSILVFLAVLILMLGTQVALAHGVLNLWGIGWNQPEAVTVLIKSGKRVSEQAVDDVETAIVNWNSELSSVDDAPLLKLVEGQRSADIVIRMKVGGGVILGMASAKTVSPFSRDIQRVTISLSGKAMGQSFGSAGLRNTARHELGHALGLGHHSADEWDLMYAEGDPYTDTDSPITDCDISGIEAIYAAIAATTYTPIPPSIGCD